METYIITFENLVHYKSNEFTDNIKETFKDGLISIVRVSDFKVLNDNGEWVDIENWND